VGCFQLQEGEVGCLPQRGAAWAVCCSRRGLFVGAWRGLFAGAQGGLLLVAGGGLLGNNRVRHS
jgi:hypothetical protein